jgi:hypothetical protein
VTWFRTDTGVGDHELVGAIAEALNLTVPAAVGHYVLTLAGFAEYRRDGLVTAVTDMTLEEWAKWRGKRGRFAQFFREHCVEHREGQRDLLGTVKGWWRQEALFREQERKRTRPGQGSREAEQRREGREQAARGFTAESPPVPRGNVDVDSLSSLPVLSGTSALNGAQPEPIRYTQRCTAAANRGLRENPLIEGFNELVSSAQDEPEEWHTQGIPVAVAEQAIYHRAKTYRPRGSRRQPTTLGYFREAVGEAWAKTQGRQLEADLNTVPEKPEGLDEYELAARRLEHHEAPDAG